MRVRTISPADSADLRRRVLRGGRDVPLPGDEAPAFHVGAYDGAGDGWSLVGTGNIRLDSQLGSETWWRVRGMATEPDARGAGVGSAVLGALLDHARQHGGGGVWLNARTPARSFYERHGFSVQGEVWDEPEIGPHVLMIRGR